MSDAEVVRQAWEAFRRRDIEAVGRLLDPGVRWHGAEAEEGHEDEEAGCYSRSEALNFIRETFDAGPTAESLHVREAGDRVPAIVQLGAPPEGGPPPEPHGELATVREGKITEMLV